jgi:hypothetical protein
MRLFLGSCPCQLGKGRYSPIFGWIGKVWRSDWPDFTARFQAFEQHSRLKGNGFAVSKAWLCLTTLYWPTATLWRLFCPQIGFGCNYWARYQIICCANTTISKLSTYLETLSQFQARWQALELFEYDQACLGWSHQSRILANGFISLIHTQPSVSSGW